VLSGARSDRHRRLDLLAAGRALPRLGVVALAVIAIALAAPPPAPAADYAGPLIDAHSHLPNAAAIDAYVAAMKRHGVTRVILLGVGGVQKDDAAWIAAAARKYPDRVVVGMPVPDPADERQAARLEAALGEGARALGEVHVRQVSRKIDRNPADPAFGRILELAARRGLPVVIHQELDQAAGAGLEKALAAHPKATIVLAHAGGATPAVLEPLLTRHQNLVADLSGMHFQRSPALASERGPLDPAWKALVEKMPDRFLMGIDVWAPRLFEPAMLDRLMAWTRRVLGELKPEVAERVAHRNATALFRLE
jgi:predicted TIM-barrel fold metal-dependent hydrolase